MVLIKKTLRNRVSYVEHLADASTEVSKTYYSYDAHGNVDKLLKDLEGFEGGEVEMRYDYDLVSGAVNEVHYNPGDNDEYYHKYEYDADNRLTNVYTSQDYYLWTEEAEYFLLYPRTTGKDGDRRG